MIKGMSLPLAGFTATAGGAIAVTSFPASAVQALPATEWASFAARYQQFRVRSVTLKFVPANNVSIAGVGDGRVFVSDYIGTAVPTTAAQVLADEHCRIKTAMKPWQFTTTWKRNPNAKLWNPTSAALPVANNYSIVIASPVDFAAAQPIGFITYHWVVEFRGSQ